MKVKITLKRSLIGQKPKARETVRSLGLKKINSTTERELNPMVEGMLHKIEHLEHHAPHGSTTDLKIPFQMLRIFYKPSTQLMTLEPQAPHGSGG